MREFTRLMGIVISSSLMRSVYTKDPYQGILVLAALGFHEAYVRKRGALGPSNLLYLLMWVMWPKAYILWLIGWEIAMIPTTRKKKMISRNVDGVRSKAVVEHKGVLMPSYLTNLEIWKIGKMFELDILGSNLEIEFVDKVEADDPVTSEEFVLQNAFSGQDIETGKCDISKLTMMVTIVVIGFMVGGHIGMAVGGAISVVVFATNPGSNGFEEHVPTNPKEFNRSNKLPKPDGIYRIQATVMGCKRHVGIGYIANGVMYTRYHVTRGVSIDIDNTLYQPTYVNRVRDGIAYGGNPKLASVSMDDEITVALAGPNFSHVLSYRTKANVDSDGNLVFRGDKKLIGCTGSPIFRIIKETKETGEYADFETTYRYVLVGTVGWPDEDDSVIESSPNTKEDKPNPSLSCKFKPNEINQVFMHPGAGKTRNVAVDLIEDGKMKYGKVYFTGPTRTVCEEAYEALSEKFPNEVSLLTSSASMLERGSSYRPIIITAHATALNMIARGSAEIARKGLWIMDEAHFMDSKTLVLKDSLRHKTTEEKEGTLVEMTATGYDVKTGTYVMECGSNSPIQDIYMSPKDMVEEIVRLSLEQKVLVFITTRRGGAITSASSIGARVEQAGGHFVVLCRDTFSSKYKEAKNMDKGAILTTDISECGANIHPDIVFDFQMTCKVVALGKSAVIEKRKIDKGQMVQRRGRVGRVPNPRYPAKYVSPGLDLPDYDYTRIEHHERVAAAKALGHKILDPVPQYNALSDISPTAKQVAHWASMGEGGTNSLRMIDMAVDKNGRPYNSTELSKRIVEWVRADNVTVRDGNQTTECGWWDERDSDILYKILYKHGALKGELRRKDESYSCADLLRKMILRGKTPIEDRLGIRECKNNIVTADNENDPEACNQLAVMME